MRCFRGMRAAASLKPRPLEREDRAGGMFPRHACRGLIEALRAGGDHEPGCRGFRGMRAAASLKL